MSDAPAQRILLVEDNAELGAQIRDHLIGAGFAVSWVKRGDDALCEDPTTYDLIVLDLMLPGAYGLDVLKKYRASADTPSSS